jgi:hypothetical protein
MNLPTCNYDRNSGSVSLPNVTLWFSYKTLIAFQFDGKPRVVSENCWSNTTGKHLNAIDGGDKSSRVDRATFEKLWQEQSESEPAGLLG